MAASTASLGAPLVAQLVKNLPEMQETGVRSLRWEDPLEKGTATHSSILAWRIPWGCKESDTAEQLLLLFSLLLSFDDKLHEVGHG